MKTKLTIALLLIAFVAATTYARQNAEATVKVLPSTQKGVLKILYANDIDQSVEVKFFNDEGIISSDEIKGSVYPHGFLKKYDVRQLKNGNLWVEISSPNLSVTYKLVGSEDHTITPFLEKSTTTYNHLVAKNN